MEKNQLPSDKGIVRETNDRFKNQLAKIDETLEIAPILAMKRRSRLLACQSHKANWKKRYFSEKKHDKKLISRTRT